MNDQLDIETVLKKFDHRPDPRLRGSILDRFRERLGPTRSGRSGRFFWVRPVPLYLAAISLCIAAGLSFLAGRQVNLSDAPADTFRSSVFDTTLTLPEERLWRAAPDDIL
jgi:hypothetical protein